MPALGILRYPISATRKLQWNFFRIHLACFTLIPLVASGILYAGNGHSTGDAESGAAGKQKVEYVDCLFLCYSMMTTTGLVTVNLSSLQPFQQFFLLILTIVGDVSFVALLMVLVRKRFFRVHCQELLARDGSRRQDQTRRTVTFAPVSDLGSRVVKHSEISAPIQSEPLYRYTTNTPARHRDVSFVVADPAPNMRSMTRSEDIEPHPRHLIRTRTLGQSSFPSQTRSLTMEREPVNIGFGGYSPFKRLAKYLVRHLRLPVRDEQTSHTLLTRETVDPGEDWSETVRQRIASWLPEGVNGLVIGRNSRFFTEELGDDELEQIGGVEFRALRFLTYFISAYIFLSQVLPFAMIATYFTASGYWSDAFQASPGDQSTSVSPVWASLYLSVSAYTGAGTSLVDQSLVPFASCYFLIWILNLTMLLGNHAFPMMLRLLIWMGTLITGRTTLNQTLHFLLDHPRRCFLYLFPSHQTWYLVLALAVFVVIEMFSFLVLNIGLPVLSNIPTGAQKFSDGFLQSLSVRASGFGIVSIANLSPSTLFLYVILMYIAIYPIALSVRSTNVYEEQALGVYDPEESETPEPAPNGKQEIFSKYLLWHVRRQLAFDVWPLALAIFVIACFERNKLMGDTGTWFTLFRIIFECTSAYSLIGLSMGTPNNNFSFAGEFTVMSKIVIMLVMIRGRHRGLPVAIDRAIMLPKAFSRP